MVEIIHREEELSESAVLRETQTSLAALKQEIDSDPDALYRNKLEAFGNFLEKQNLGAIDRKTTLGRFLRVARYGDHIWDAAKANNVEFQYLFALIMVESQGNTASINESDGGAGFIHFQPDVAKEYGMKIFTDNPKYKKYDFATMRKAGKTKEEIYKKHGEILKSLMGKGMPELEKLDDRFHTIKCINATAKYLSKIKTHYVDKQVATKCSDPSWNIYKKDTEFDFKWMLTLNGFNKGPANFTKGFESGSHVKNIKHNLTMARKYQEYVVNNAMDGASFDKIFVGLQKEKF